MTPTEKLRKMIIDSGEYCIDIAEQTGVNVSVISRFASGLQIQSHNFDKLCEYFELDIVEKQEG